MHRHQLRLLAVLGASILTAVVAQAQNTAPRGATRLDSGGLRLLHGSTAVYPEAARNSGIEGTVVIEATLDARGHVMDGQVVSGAMELRAAALKSILDDHFASDGSFPKKAQLRVVFSLDKASGRSGSVPGGFVPPNNPGAVLSIECQQLPAELCRDARELLAAYIGSLWTPETRTEAQKALDGVDDHLMTIPRKTANGVVLVLWIRYESSPDTIVGGILGGLPSAAAPPPPPPPPPRNPEAYTKPQRISVPELVQEAKLISKPRPVYPPLANAGRVQGTVKLSAIIAKDGSIQTLQLISGHPLLTPAALEAVKQWQYQPTLLNGEPVEVATQISVNFTLSQ